MNFTAKLHMPKAALAAAAALAILAPGMAQADAIAQAILTVSNFSLAPGAGIQITNAATSGDVSASLNGAPATTQASNTNGLFTLNVSQGAGYNPLVPIPGPATPTSTYTGSYAAQNGSVLFGTGTAEVDNTVSLFPAGVGSAQSNVNLAASFNVNVTTASAINFSFDATGFLRAYLGLDAGQSGSARAAYQWNVSIVDENDDEVFFWEPNGSVGGITGGTETADAFDMTANRSRLQDGNAQIGVFSGSFAAFTNTLAVGSYTLNIDHNARSDAQVVPEPGALSLVGLALFGLAAVSRRRQK